VPFRRRRWDEQPAQPCGVLLASDGRQDFSPRAVARAAALSGEGERVAVVTIAKIYGSAYGLPNPGLLPTKREMAERRGWVNGAIRKLEREGLVADGQIAATRRASKKLAGIARLRRPRAVVIDENPMRGWRRIVEGDVGAELRRKLRKDGIDVEIVPRPGVSKPTG
jgi:hypothetical protein